MNACSQHDWREQKIREWLLMMLRIAITREPRDRFAVFAIADGLDALEHYWGPTAGDPRLRRTFGAAVDLDQVTMSVSQ
jgi:hypothetical protein